MPSGVAGLGQKSGASLSSATARETNFFHRRAPATHLALPTKAGGAKHTRPSRPLKPPPVHSSRAFLLPSPPGNKWCTRQQLHRLRPFLSSPPHHGTAAQAQRRGTPGPGPTAATAAAPSAHPGKPPGSRASSRERPSHRQGPPTPRGRSYIWVRT